ncbi:MAG: IS5 family transposase [Geminicoccaceae bacterium]
MQPKTVVDDGSEDLFRSRLEAMIDLRHELVKLAKVLDWSVFEDAFGPLYHESQGRPGLPTRLMVGLHLLKHKGGVSDEQICARYLDSPYVQHFCGEVYFQHELPLDRSSLTRWRQRVGPEKLEVLLAESLAAGLRERALSTQHLARVTVDTTVQPKAITPPTDAHLLLRALERLVKLAKAHGIKLCQSYARTARWAKQQATRLMYRGRKAAGERQLRWLRTRLGRVIRDIQRKTDGNADLEALFAEPLARAERIQSQKKGDKGKLYAFHAPEVECLGKGKPKTRYEFGVKVSVAVTSAVAKGGHFVIGMQSLPGHPYDGHSLQAQIKQTTRLTGIKPERVYADRGYRGHDAENKGTVFISGQKRGLTPTIKRELKRRSAIEPVIGYMKSDGLLDRNHLKGAEGDAINAILATVGRNLRLLARWLIIVLGKITALTAIRAAVAIIEKQTFLIQSRLGQQKLAA